MAGGEGGMGDRRTGWIVWIETNEKREGTGEDEHWTGEKESAIAPVLPAGGICVPITRLRTQMLPSSLRIPKGGPREHRLNMSSPT